MTSQDRTPTELCQQPGSLLLIKTVPVELSGPAGKKLCLVYLDEGSSLTLITQKVAEELGLHQRPRNLTMKKLTASRSFSRHSLT